ncbi:MAG TPA: toll/interleukin-1 receptor domain-containing protein [Pyrinomonadaceae bacterium]|jgi:hypothetical protein
MSRNATTPHDRPASIFINYRREDTAGHAGRLFDALSHSFPGRVFMDIDKIEPGQDFVEAIGDAVGKCSALLVLVGRDWLNVTDAAGRRRLDDPNDFVVAEVAAALNRNIRVIPVLVRGASMPRENDLPPALAKLARRNAIELSDTRWAYDVERLIQSLRGVLEGAPAPDTTARAAPAAAPARPAAPGSRAVLVLVACLVVVGLLGVVGWVLLRAGGEGLPRESSAASVSQANTANGRAPAQALDTGAAQQGFETVPTQDGFVSVREAPTTKSAERRRVAAGTRITCQSVVKGEPLWGTSDWRYCPAAGGYVHTKLLIPVP